MYMYIICIHIHIYIIFYFFQNAPKSFIIVPIEIFSNLIPISNKWKSSLTLHRAFVFPILSNKLSAKFNPFIEKILKYIFH